MLPKLFGLDSKGCIKEWSVVVFKDTVQVHFGKLDGKIQTKTTFCKGKNIGRSNETTPEEQAILEAQSKWNKQKDKSYCEDVNNIQPMLNPMLAQDYNKAGHRIKFPCIGGFKLDGVRCTVSRVGSEPVLKSRGGKVYPTPKHLSEALSQLLKATQGIPVDGELYIHGVPLNEIVSIARKPENHTEQLEFHIFDVCDTELPNYVRQEMLEDLRIVGLLEWPLALVHTEVVTCEDHLKSLHGSYVNEGYEGIMLRNNLGMYKFDTRSSDLQKYKEFKDAEYQIIDVVQDKDGFGVFVCDCPDSLHEDKTFKVMLKGTHEERKAVWDNKDSFLGSWLTVKYQALTPFNIPQFPVGLRLRECDAEGNPLN